jgi:hypothetical protein
MIRTESKFAREQNVALFPDVLFSRSPQAESKFAHSSLSKVPFYSIEQLISRLNKESKFISHYLSLVQKDDFIEKQAQGYESVVFRLSLGAPDLAFKIYMNTSYGLFLIEELLSYVQGLSDDAKKRVLDWANHQHHSDVGYGKKSYVLRQAIAFQVARKLNPKFVPPLTGVFEFSNIPVAHITPYLPGTAMCVADLEFMSWADQTLELEFLRFLEELEKRNVYLDRNGQAKNAIIQQDAGGKITDVKMIDMDKID